MGDTNSGLLWARRRWLACVSALRDTGVRTTECRSGEQGPRDAWHAGVKERGAQACDAPTHLANELQSTEQVFWKCRARCAQRMSWVGMLWRYGRDAGMVWGTGGLDQTRAEIWTPGARLAASLMSLSQPPDIIYFQPVGRAPATTGRDVRASAGAQPAPGPWLEPGQIAPPSDARLALGWRWGPLSLQPRNQTKHSERQPCVAFLMQGLAHAAEDLSRITRLFLALFAEDASERN